MSITTEGKSSERSQILEPLRFNVKCHASSDTASDVTSSASASANSPNSIIKCIFCDEHFNGCVEYRDDFIRHLLTQHKFVIGDIKVVPDFKKYIEYWRLRFKGRSKNDFCSVIRTNTGENDLAPSEDYFLLCDHLPEDRGIRNELQIQKLKEVLEQQQREREDANFNHGCLFCNEHFTTNRADLFNHMAESHNFNIGHPDNLVYTDELLQLLTEKRNRCICFFCEKNFKDRYVLKEHMRKKQHKQINPKDKKYDRFYIINYLEIGKTWEDIQTENDSDLLVSTDTDSDWDDWTEHEMSAVCLYCDFNALPHRIIAHLRDDHSFDLRKITDENKFTFYQQIKLVNYIRRQIYQTTCPTCDTKYGSNGELQDHLAESVHTSSVPDSELWDQPEYFFPTYENDNLLCSLEILADECEKGAAVTPEESIEQVTDAVVIAEDLNIEESISRRSYIMKEYHS